MFIIIAIAFEISNVVSFTAEICLQSSQLNLESPSTPWLRHCVNGCQTFHTRSQKLDLG